MKFEVITSNNLSDTRLNNYVDKFNSIFKTSYDLNYFKRKYLSSTFGFSFHSFLVHNNKIQGACTAIPYEYKINSKSEIICLAVDVFIDESFRNKNPFTLLKMYHYLKQKLLSYDVKAVLAVPNDNAYMYWKTNVKWKDLKQLNYYIFLNKIPTKILNTSFIGKLTYHFLKFFNRFFYNGIHSKENLKPINIIKNNFFEKSRYCGNQIIFSNNEFYFTYSIVNEKNIKTCYLIDHSCVKNGISNIESLDFALRNIVQFDIHLVIFVGEIFYNQKYLIKVPKFLEPKKLNLMIDLLDKNFETVLLNPKNWNFGLLNFDVR